jgi:Interferon-induced transmembrane protein/zinc-ribbon domain
MYCTNCGSPRGDNATACANCGTAVQHFPPPAPVNNYLIPAVLTTFCCCLPAGVVAIIYAAQVNSKLAAGDIAGAMHSSRLARTWTWVAVGGAVVVALGYAVLLAIGIAADRS